jgi:hypothetical protein
MGRGAGTGAQVKPATELCVTINEDGGLLIETREQGLRRARALVRKYIPQGVSLSAEMIADHRAETARERQK